MPVKAYVRITYNGVKVRLPIGSDDPLKFRMFQLAQFGVSILRERVDQMKDSSDGAMPPLSTGTSEFYTKNGKRIAGKLAQTVGGYAAWKAANLGNSDRNLFGPGSRTFRRRSKGGSGKTIHQRSGTGHMLDDIHVTQADERRAQIAITTTAGREKALRNEYAIRRKGGMGWWGWSPRNVSQLVEAGRKIVDERATTFRLGFAGIPAQINKAIPPWGESPRLRTFGGGW
jgi:hypothetical protein